LPWALRARIDETPALLLAGARPDGQYLLTAFHQFDILKSGLSYWGAGCNSIN
jgi:hypothetical protein